MIFFDVDGTLLDHKTSEYISVLIFYEENRDFLTCDKEKFYEIWRKIADQHFNRYLSGKLSFLQQGVARIKEIFFSCGVKLSEKEAEEKFKNYLQTYENNWTAYDDVQSLTNLNKKYRLGIITNGDLKQQSLKLEKMGIKNLFEVIISARDVGLQKPDLEIFKIACSMVDISPDRCYYVGDDLEKDILPCQTIGMKGIWINRNKIEYENSNIDIIYSLNELKDILSLRNSTKENSGI